MSITTPKVLRLAFLALLVLSLSACSTPSGSPVGSPATDSRPIPVEAVNVLIGTGSPIPVDVFVSGSWPDLCAQISQVTQSVEGFAIHIDLLAAPADPDCPPDNQALPFRIAIPLNAVELPQGHYTVTVNEVSTEFDWPSGDK